jgi:hypothetical protein
MWDLSGLSSAGHQGDPELDSGSLRKTAMLAAERFRIRQASLPVRNDVLGSFEIVP